MVNTTQSKPASIDTNLSLVSRRVNQWSIYTSRNAIIVMLPKILADMQLRFTEIVDLDKNSNDGVERAMTTMKSLVVIRTNIAVSIPAAQGARFSAMIETMAGSVLVTILVLIGVCLQAMH